jgi:hypothetical protein
VPAASSTSRDQAIFADQVTEASLLPDAVRVGIGRFGAGMILVSKSGQGIDMSTWKGLTVTSHIRTLGIGWCDANGKRILGDQVCDAAMQWSASHWRYASIGEVP